MKKLTLFLLLCCIIDVYGQAKLSYLFSPRNPKDVAIDVLYHKPIYFVIGHDTIPNFVIFAVDDSTVTTQYLRYCNQKAILLGFGYIDGLYYTEDKCLFPIRDFRKRR